MRLMIKKYPITLFFLGLTGLVFLIMQLVYGQFATHPYAVVIFGGMNGLVVRAMPGQLWRLVTPIVVHIGFGHFFINVLTLYFVGRLAESIWGSRQFLLLYVCSGIMGNAFIMWLTPDTVAAGASTSLFGLFAAIAVLGMGGNSHSLRELGRSYQALIVMNLLLNLFMPNVSIAGHLGGVVGGGLCGVALSNQLPNQAFSSRQRRLAALAYVVIVVGIVSRSFLSLAS
ncbi:rhomboid family intramembrane serine protease [Streptococcus equi]|uniref:rhomboid family intramembrane serine protease n=1 Tax=Streptococcus equi TaxID=1336 RepID=UPI0005BB534E|nr:rhomboid family intramembrane serine protease [Streptococcus equi]KIS20684.1 rhomboid family membrane protein [Streptococcus equi subsp. zooepidemicus SzAM35]